MLVKRSLAQGLAMVLIAATVPAVVFAADQCPTEPCGCNGPDPIDTAPYFIPNYSGWQTARRVWTFMGGGTTQYRMFKYSSDDYELIKSPDGTSTETFEVTASWIYVTSEVGPGILGSPSRIYNGNGLKFIPRVICPNKPTFRPCHEGEQLINATSCLPIGQTPSHCATYSSRIDLAPAWNYGYSVGVVDSIVKTDKLDDGKVEKYWYGRNRGLLRWELYSAAGVLLNWGQQTSEIPNSAIPHNTCAQPQ